jgi:hypothetical protein
MATATAHPLLALLEYAVARPEPLDEQVARIAWTLARTSANTGLMTEIAKRPEIPDDVRMAVGQVKDAAVRAAYLRRADLDPAERRSLLESETRGKVLAVLAGDPDTDAATLDILAEHKTVLVCMAVVTNDAAPIEIRRKAILTLSASDKELNSKQGADARAFILEDTEGHNEYALQLSPYRLDILTSSETVGPDGIRRIVDECITKKVKQITGKNTERYIRERCANEVANTINEMLLLPELPDTLFRVLERALTAIEPHVSSYHQPKPQQIKERLTSRASGPLAKYLATARQSTDPEELAQLVVPGQDSAILHTVARNRASSAATTVSAWKLGDQRSSSRGLIEARAGQDDVLLALWVADYWPMRRWVPAPGNETLIIAMLEHKDASINAKTDLIRALHEHDMLPENAISYLTQEAFEHCWVGSIIPELGIEALVAGVQHTPPELLLSVANGFSGNLGELLGTCQLLAADE